MKRDKYDAIFSNLVRERADYKCETCGKSYRESPGGLHCSHIFSRRHTRTRWDADNAMAQCWGCHQKYGSNPVEFYWLLENIFGKGHLEILQGKKQQIFRMKKYEKEEMYKFYRNEYKKMMEKRREGVTGRIEFEGYF
jgi:DNA-directed RNA polymerase beta' subunit